MATKKDPIEQLRAICMALPEVVERDSHGEPTWFIRGKRSIAMLDNHHHGANHLAFWCPAALGVQEALIEQRPEQFFRPPYVGEKGWIGMRIDKKPDWDEVLEFIEDAYRLVAPKKLSAQLDADD
jgi:hypothetical protein